MNTCKYYSVVISVKQHERKAQFPSDILKGIVFSDRCLLYVSLKIGKDILHLLINIFLLILAIRVMGWRYFFRTIIVILIISVLIGILQEKLTYMGADGQEHLTCIIGNQKFMASVIGGLMEGLGLAVIFLAGGSTGGTDIIASCVNKYRDISLGRILLSLDIIIVGTSYFLSRNLETMVVGYVTMFISMNFLDFVINGARQSVQFTIISKKHEEIAQQIAEQVERGVTIIYGEGWYSKQERRVLIVMARRRESTRIFRLIKHIDNQAFVTMTKVVGVYGEGFDRIKT